MTFPNSKISLILVIAAGAIAFFFVWFYFFGGRQFESITWANEKLALKGGRLEMADDIVNRKLLNGKSRNEVIALLGQPSETSRFCDWHLVYWLGAERSLFSIDSEWLVVRFGKNERVEEYAIVRD